MMTNFLREVRESLPLRIEQVSWEDAQFNINGEGWFFNLVGEWRITDNEKVLAGCYDDFVQDYVQKLKGTSIVDIKPLSGPPYIDPVFILSNGFRIEIFSTKALEPWRMMIAENHLYIAEPNDANHAI
jgi:hypothetical protein